ncbi:hypothetical protein SAMN03159341_101534 [Paenibacillus sp. 1_12]|nr:hypothetical protein SAMN03159341_101534 [Paenibacillus sp. 1_12]
MIVKVKNEPKEYAYDAGFALAKPKNVLTMPVSLKRNPKNMLTMLVSL